ncbi:MAG TPA: hypothetical protein VF131_24670 [Blastocatellia bacterium]|nr:hypothetical protein [Blastocatellia bacterium]
MTKENNESTDAKLRAWGRLWQKLLAFTVLEDGGPGATCEKPGNEQSTKLTSSGKP